MLFHKLTLGPMQNNCYIATDEESNDAAIFDVPFDGQAICDFLDEQNYNLKYIILTHSHFDHVTAVGYVKDNYPLAQVLIHKNGEKSLNNPNTSLSAALGYNLPSTKADILLSDGDIIELGGIKMQIIHTPGHTTDSICVLINDILISGDTLFYNEIGRCDLPGGNFEQEINSIKQKLMVLGDNITVYPGHDRETTIGTERRKNPYLKKGQDL